MKLGNLLISLTILLATGCAHRSQQNLDATLYLQTAAEYEAIALQTFRMARDLATEGLQDPSWSALATAVVQKPPAVIVDVDETVLDNSAYQARLILDNEEFGRASWKAWVEEAVADPVPGALEFARWAEQQDIVIFYVTNRRADEEAATRRNLEALGFPVRQNIDVVLTSGEREDWTSDKTTRRDHVAESFRVLLLIGDDLGDFLPRNWSGVESRHEVIVANREKWGRQWLVVPNPTYGSWVSALLGAAPPDSASQRLRILHEALDPKRDD